MDYSFWLGKTDEVEYDVIPCPPDWIMVEVKKPASWADQKPFISEPLSSIPNVVRQMARVVDWPEPKKSDE